MELVELYKLYADENFKLFFEVEKFRQLLGKSNDVFESKFCDKEASSMNLSTILLTDFESHSILNSKFKNTRG